MSKWWIVINALKSVKLKKATFMACIDQSSKLIKKYKGYRLDVNKSLKQVQICQKKVILILKRHLLN